MIDDDRCSGALFAMAMFGMTCPQYMWKTVSTALARARASLRCAQLFVMIDTVSHVRCTAVVCAQDFYRLWGARQRTITETLFGFNDTEIHEVRSGQRNATPSD